jgi:hypothetical protein
VTFGLAGVIAVLAQAQERGVQVAGQKQALENMVGCLLEQREFDDAGAYWPAHLPLARWLAPLASFKPDTPFGYVYSRPVVGGEFDLPGLLEGTAGIALVLHAYATKSAPTTEWGHMLPTALTEPPPCTHSWLCGPVKAELGTEPHFRLQLAVAGGAAVLSPSRRLADRRLPARLAALSSSTRRATGPQSWMTATCTPVSNLSP